MPVCAVGLASRRRRLAKTTTFDQILQHVTARRSRRKSGGLKRPSQKRSAARAESRTDLATPTVWSAQRLGRSGLRVKVAATIDCRTGLGRSTASRGRSTAAIKKQRESGGHRQGPANCGRCPIRCPQGPTVARRGRSLRERLHRVSAAQNQIGRSGRADGVERRGQTRDGDYF